MFIMRASEEYNKHWYTYRGARDKSCGKSSSSTLRFSELVDFVKVRPFPIVQSPLSITYISISHLVKSYIPKVPRLSS